MRAFWERDDGTSRQIATACLIAAMAIAAGFLLIEAHGLTLLYDEWYFGYALRTGHELSAFLMPHNGHFVIIPVIVYKTVLEVFGVSGVLAIRLLAVAVHVSVGALLYVSLRRVFSPLAALVPSVLLLFLGSANDVIVDSHGWPLTLSVATGLAAWLALRERRLRWDIAAMALLTVGVCSDGYALPFCFGAIVVILLDRESSWKRLWVPAVPLFIFALWWLVEGRTGGGGFAIANVAALPSFAFDSLAAALSALTGAFTVPGARFPSIDIAPGQALAGAFLVGLLALVLARQYRPPRQALPAIVALLVFWLLTASVATPARIPTSGRYFYVSVTLLILILAEGIAASRFRNEGAIALAAICAFALLPNIREMTYGADGFQTQSEIDRAVLGAANLAVGHAPGSATIESPEEGAEGNVFDLGLTLEQYVASRERFGTPAYSAAQIEAAQPIARAAADRVLARLLGLALAPAEAAPRALPTHVETSQTGGALTPDGGCLRFRPFVAGAQLTVAIPPSGLWIGARAGPEVAMAWAVR